MGRLTLLVRRELALDVRLGADAAGTATADITPYCPEATDALLDDALDALLDGLRRPEVLGPPQVAVKQQRSQSATFSLMIEKTPLTRSWVGCLSPKAFVPPQYPPLGGLTEEEEEETVLVSG